MKIVARISLIVLLAASFTSHAQTTLIVDGTNRLVGIQELQVGTDRFDVTFAAGQYDDAFTANEITPVFIGNELGANAATIAIFDAINADGRFVDLPQNIGGCSDLVFLECGIQVPFNGPYATGFPSTPFGVDVWTAFFGVGSGGVLSQPLATSGLGLIDTATWAVFTPSEGSNGPAELLEKLEILVTGEGPGNSLADKIMLAAAYLEVPDELSACLMLGDFLNQVRAQRGKKLTEEQADTFTSDAEDIIAAIGCD
jgi:hypothetical protein